MAHFAELDENNIVKEIHVVADSVAIIQFINTIKIRIFQKYARHMCVSDKAEVINPFKNSVDLVGIGIDIVWKDVFSNRPPW